MIPINLQLMEVLLGVPLNTVKLILTAKILNEDETFTEVTTTMNLQDIIQARVDAEFWIDENGRWIVNEERVNT